MSGLPAAPRVRLRIVLEDGVSIGPGKADLLESIRATGSISAAARRMQMSYKRAWLLIDELNGMFDAPLVATSKGGAQGGGARLSGLGERVLALYREAEARSGEAARDDVAALRAMLRR
jgi:molybdate transport system regulatory protein